MPDINSDLDEQHFTESELSRAAELRQRVTPDFKETHRSDHCPHTPMCENWDVCVKRIAWYLRYQSDIEQA